VPFVPFVTTPGLPSSSKDGSDITFLSYTGLRGAEGLNAPENKARVFRPV
jgi:hypothetical protein